MFLTAHGVNPRLSWELIGGFGEFLNTKGFFIGVPLAWGITAFEIAGGSILAFDFYVKWTGVVFMIELIMGIFHVHVPNGWFVAGATQEGMEYSSLLLLVFTVISAHHYENARLSIKHFQGVSSSIDCVTRAILQASR